MPDLRAALGVRSAVGGSPRCVWLVGMASHATLLAVVVFLLAVVARLVAAVSTPAGKWDPGHAPVCSSRPPAPYRKSWPTSLSMPPSCRNSVTLCSYMPWRCSVL